MTPRATSFGGPYILLPRRKVPEWINRMGETPEPDRGLYGQLCSDNDYLFSLPFSGSSVLRLGEGPADLFWQPGSDGGLAVQWIGADSEEALLQFAREIAAADAWEESLEISVPDQEIRIMDSCGFENDGQPKIDIELQPGLYRASATYAENERTMAVVVRLQRIRDEQD